MSPLKRIFLVAFILFLLACGVAGCAVVRFLFLSKIMAGSSDEVSDLQFAPKYTPEAIKKISFPQNLVLLSQNSDREVLSGLNLIQKYEALKYSEQKEACDCGISIKETMAKKPLKVWAIPDQIDVCRGPADFKRAREFARVEALIGQYLIAKGNASEGVPLLLGVAYLGSNLCLEHPERVSLILQMVARAIFNIAANGFISSAKDLHPDREMVKMISEHLNRARTLLPPLSLSYRMERKVISGFAEAYKKQAEGIKAAGGKIYSEEFATIAEKAEPHLKELFDKWFPFLDLPWKEGWAHLSQSAQENDRYMQENLELSGPMSYLKRLIDPYEAVAGIMLSIMVPNSAGGFRAVWESNQRIEGAITVLALEAFQNEKGRAAASIEELADWWKSPIGRDFFAEKSLTYIPDKSALSSVGVDGKPDTKDDIIFLPLEKQIKH
ncbi:MAG: hypothetical protein HQM08_14530 [Candidatus Riflebacteria bacterium]|nr:hypothetical protein [Candidatus Riflebacteria bacterium]